MGSDRPAGPWSATVAAAGTALVGLAFLGATAPGPVWRELLAAAARAGFWSSVVIASARVGAWLTGSKLGGLAHLVWDGAAGLPLLIASWLVVGLFPGGFARGPIVIVLALFATAAVAIGWRDRTIRRRDASLAATGLPGVLAIVLAGAIVFAGLAWDRVPPVFFDTLAYHWAQPALWIVEGRVAPVAWSIHSWYPPGMSVLYGVGLALSGGRLAGDANLMAGLLLLGMAWDLGRRRSGAASALAALVVLATFPIVILALGIPAADLGHGMFAAGALAALAVARSGDEASWRRRAAWIAAGAVLTKFLGVLVPLALGAAWLGIGRDADERSMSVSRRAGRAAAFALPALILFAPWLVANERVTGNPIAPVAASIVPPVGLAEGGAAAFAGDARGGWPSAAELPVLARRLFGGEVSSPFYPAPAWGLMPLVLLLTLPLVPRTERNLDLLALAAAAFAVWFATYRWERFLVAVTFLLSVAMGGLLAAAWRTRRAARIAPLLALLIGAASTLSALSQVASFTGGASVALGREDAQSFFLRSFTTARVVREAAPQLDPKTTRILFVGETRHYGIGFDHVAPTGFNVHPVVAALAAGSGPSSARAELVRGGFTHLLVDPGWIERSGRSYPSLASIVADPAPFAALVRSLGPPIATDDGVSLYAIVK